MTRRFVNPPPPRGLSAQEYEAYTKAIGDLRVVLAERQESFSLDKAVAVLEAAGWTCTPPAS